MKKNKSRLWTQPFDEVKNNLYDYESQELFLKEASLILDEIYKHYNKYQIKFHLDGRSVKKAIWMLHLDALDTLRDCIALLKKKKHKIVGKLFRDIFETIDLSNLFWEERNKGSKNLKKWYKNIIILHSDYRNHLKTARDVTIIKEGEELIIKAEGKIIAKVKRKLIDKTEEEITTYAGGEIIAKTGADIYRALSEWTHHTYRILKHSYSLGGKNGKMLVYDGYSDKLISHQVLSRYTLDIKDFVLYFLGAVKRVGLINWKEIVVFLNKTIHGIEFI